MSDELERDWVADEIAEIEAGRTRQLEARAANPHLRSEKSDEQLRVIDRQLAELREMAT